MGKATRWLKGFLGMKKEKTHVENSGPLAGDRKEKKRWSFGKSPRDSSTVGHSPVSIPGNIPVADSAWLRSYIADSENEQNKHAIAVAAATAAAADAAVAAAQAAVAVVRLTSQGRGTLFSGGREKWAAVKIQTVFRGCLVSRFLNFVYFVFATSNGSQTLIGLIFHSLIWVFFFFFFHVVMKCF